MEVEVTGKWRHVGILLAHGSASQLGPVSL